jgi:hypothetical protein
LENIYQFDNGIDEKEWDTKHLGKLKNANHDTLVTNEKIRFRIHPLSTDDEFIDFYSYANRFDVPYTLVNMPRREVYAFTRDVKVVRVSVFLLD